MGRLYEILENHWFVHWFGQYSIFKFSSRHWLMISGAARAGMPLHHDVLDFFKKNSVMQKRFCILAELTRKNRTSLISGSTPVSLQKPLSRSELTVD